MTARTPEEIAEITGGPVDDIRAAFDAVRILRSDDDE